MPSREWGTLWHPSTPAQGILGILERPSEHEHMDISTGWALSCCHPETAAGVTSCPSPPYLPQTLGAGGQLPGKAFGSGSGRIPSWREEWSWSLT